MSVTPRLNPFMYRPPQRPPRAAGLQSRRPGLKARTLLLAGGLAVVVGCGLGYLIVRFWL